ncbi:MAG TPA: hypothetical protein DEP84_29900 [Chloroflexi bacterium]|nr:hypothetical protein [Chloroflexota bacterium]
MNKQDSTAEQLTKLKAFRQMVYEEGLGKRRDAQFELLDVVATGRRIGSFPELSLSPLFRRTWSSAYKALEAGSLQEARVRRLVVEQVPEQETVVCARDGTAWPRPAAPTLPDRQYVPSPTASVNGTSVVVGQPYSLLVWVEQPASYH